MKLLKILALLSIGISSLDAKIIEMCHMTDVVALVQDASGKSEKLLVAFDICNTLAHPNNGNGWGSDQWLDAHAKRLIEVEGIEPAKAWAALLPIYFEIQRHEAFILHPVELYTLDGLQEIKRYAHTTIGLTARSHPIVSDTFRLLYHAGITFKDAGFMGVSAGPVGRGYYQDGIVFCGNINKGLVLVDTFKTFNYWPTTVIFIDDKMKNVEAVERVLAAYGIECIGIHYTHLRESVGKFALHPEWGYAQ